MEKKGSRIYGSYTSFWNPCEHESVQRNFTTGGFRAVESGARVYLRRVGAGACITRRYQMQSWQTQTRKYLCIVQTEESAPRSNHEQPRSRLSKLRAFLKIPKDLRSFQNDRKTFKHWSRLIKNYEFNFDVLPTHNNNARRFAHDASDLIAVRRNSQGSRDNQDNQDFLEARDFQDNRNFRDFKRRKAWYPRLSRIRSFESRTQCLKLPSLLIKLSNSIGTLESSKIPRLPKRCGLRKILNNVRETCQNHREFRSSSRVWRGSNLSFNVQW